MTQILGTRVLKFERKQLNLLFMVTIAQLQLKHHSCPLSLMCFRTNTQRNAAKAEPPRQGTPVGEVPGPAPHGPAALPEADQAQTRLFSKARTATAGSGRLSSRAAHGPACSAWKQAAEGKSQPFLLPATHSEARLSYEP